MEFIDIKAQYQGSRELTKVHLHAARHCDIIAVGAEALAQIALPLFEPATTAPL
ncbi:MAG: hypothetical protein ABWY27_12005 [Telluria sp.]